MDITLEIINIGLLILSILIIFILRKYYNNKINQLDNSLTKIKSDKISQSTKYGQISEEFFPLEQSYPYESKNFKFLGNPIDGIQFNDDRIIIIEFKTNKSQLSQKQKHIRDLIINNKVDFELIEAKI
jgi:predicted Holliday junction resolvase-like endonuclease